MAEFKPNIYPIMYWALLYGVIAGILLFMLFILSRFITVVWFPVFLAGLIWGGYRNYKQQKTAAGETMVKPVMQEFKEAASDIVAATREAMQEAPEPTVGTAAENSEEQKIP
ncbi:MAG TPA: hypothetical protein VJC05_03745 [Candidatus Andersenbacteria bacterium]|nr:hypothetical protein [Candidatus Andersenbacteria bacterium]